MKKMVIGLIVGFILGATIGAAVAVTNTEAIWNDVYDSSTQTLKIQLQ